MIVIRQKEYARKDYEGLTEEGKAILKEKRGDLAKQYRKRLKEINAETTEKLENIEAVYEKGSKRYSRAIKKLKEDTEKSISDELGKLNEAKNKISGSIPYSRKKPEPKLDGFVDSFKKEGARNKIKRAGEKIEEAISKNKKALIITGAGLTASGATVAGVKAIKKSKKEKASEDLKKKLRGYDNTKKKA